MKKNDFFSLLAWGGFTVSIIACGLKVLSTHELTIPFLIIFFLVTVIAIWAVVGGFIKIMRRIFSKK